MSRMNRRKFLTVAGCGAGAGALGVRLLPGTPPVPERESEHKEFPIMQVIPLPDDKASFQHDGREILRYHFGAAAPKTYCWPLIGPAGRSVIRIGHPHDPVSHRHHRGIWVAHANVNGTDFWGEDAGGTIRHEAIELLEDGPKCARLAARNIWLSPKGERLMTEKRIISAMHLPGDECAVDVVLEFLASEGEVTFGETPFGFLGVRVAKTMGVADGGGTIINSEAGKGEEGTFWKQAKWLDYSGHIAPGRWNGITFLDHPTNPRHPTYWHTRRDGWMGASFTLKEPYVLAKGDKLKLRYRLVVHDGAVQRERSEAAWQEFAAE